MCSQKVPSYHNLKNYLKYRQKLMWKCVHIAQVPSTAFLPTAQEEDIADLLEYNIAYAIIMCRLKYRRVPKKLPNTIEGMADYWKQYYNTSLGKGKPSEFIEKYNTTLQFLSTIIIYLQILLASIDSLI